MDRRNKIPWWMDAACATTDPDIFLPGLGESPVRAKKICATCPVINACLNEAMVTRAEGVRGGTTARERSVLRRGAA